MCQVQLNNRRSCKICVRRPLLTHKADETLFPLPVICYPNRQKKKIIALCVKKSVNLAGQTERYYQLQFFYLIYSISVR